MNETIAENKYGVLGIKKAYFVKLCAIGTEIKDKKEPNMSKVKET